MPDRVRVWCLRHAEAESNVAEAFGAADSTPLTDRGRRQAAAAAELLLGRTVSRVFSSPHTRAHDTATIIGDTLSVDVITMPELAEINVGAIAGADEAAARTQGMRAMQSWIVDGDLSAVFAGGEDGHHVASRMTTAFEQIALHHVGETVALIGHVASLSAAFSQICALKPDVWGTPLPHAVPFLAERGEAGWRCQEWPGALIDSGS